MEYLAIFYTAAVTGILIGFIQQARILRQRGKYDGANEAHATQVAALRESNTKLFAEKNEAIRHAADAIRSQQLYTQKPVIDESNLDQLAQAIAVRLPGNRTH